MAAINRKPGKGENPSRKKSEKSAPAAKVSRRVARDQDPAPKKVRAGGARSVKRTVTRAVTHSDDSLASYLFHQGTNRYAYRYLGFHREGGFAVFRVWAPDADSVAVVGDFTDWDVERYPMTRVTANGLWEVRIPGEIVLDGQNYKYFIRGCGKELYKADPYGFSMQKPPETASVISSIDGYIWRDEGWLRYRRDRFDRTHAIGQPINVYEVHLGSWKRRGDGSYLSYAELAEDLCSYVKQMGYTHIELLPVAEHPFDGSWGYQICGYFAPTARFGSSPKDFMAFVDKMHEAGIGVILDWVPAHFPKDAHGLFEFDGRPLYEYQDADRMESADWGTRCFDLGRREVQSFLISNAVYWAKEYHIDGLRVDAVSSMLYLDYGKKPGEWTPNVHGGNKNLEAIAFLQALNFAMMVECPDVMTIAEESTAWEHVTDFREEGLGFTFKWNMGWMNDSLSYARLDPLFRSHDHNKLTFPLTYAFGEKYILPISHDETVHGKRSLLDRFHGPYEQKFAGERVFLAYLMTHPGKKLLFMGCEIGQFREWDCDHSIEWFLLDYELHRRMQLYVAEWNRLYLETPALWENDGSWEGFRWIDADNREQSIYSYRRIAKNGQEIVVLLNFLPVRYEHFLLAVPSAGIYEEIFNSDDVRFGGRGDRNLGDRRTVPCMLRDYRNAIDITVPAMGAAIFRCVRRSPRRAGDVAADVVQKITDRRKAKETLR